MRTTPALFRIGHVVLGRKVGAALLSFLAVPLVASAAAVMSADSSPAACVGASPDPRGSGTLKLCYTNLNEAARACQTVAQQVGGTVIQTSGTSSMEPLIHGRAYVVVKKEPFAAIKKADLLVYMGRLDARTSNRTCTLHRAVDCDRYGWLMSGDNNRWTESWDRVTPDNYVGKVVMIFETQAS